jgi:NAD(P) transhydrogenase subunit alpha
MDEDFQRRQRENHRGPAPHRHRHLHGADPGRKAPILLTEAMVAAMAPGSVIVDLAVESGGNVEEPAWAKSSRPRMASRSSAI